MRWSPLVLLAITAFMTGCGSEEARKAQPADIESSAGPVGRADPLPAAATPATASEQGGRGSLTPAQRRLLRTIAATIDQVVDEFDTVARECDPGAQALCLERPWAAVVAVGHWLPYDLNRMGARGRDCVPLGYAARGIHGFSLAAAQIEYGAPPGDGVSTRRSDQLALVDGLRSVPSDLRAAAASGCP
jgi:hypothetical protein